MGFTRLPKSISKQRTSPYLCLILICGILSSCGGNKTDASLKANCDRIFTNFLAINDRPEVFPSSDVADDDTVPLLLGEETRKAAEKEILAKFPFLDEIIVGKEKDNQQIDLYYYPGSIYLISQALIGTDIEFPYTREEMKVIATQDEGWKNIVYPLATKYFGDYMETENPQGCALIDQEKENPNSENNTSVAFSRASDLYYEFASFLQAIRNCEVSGWHEGNKCAKVDYVGKSYDWTPTPTDPFTKTWSDDIQEGLAKFAWCWNQGKSFDSYLDSCV